MTETIDWATDYDIFESSYVADPYPVWEALRPECPIAHTDRWGGSWLPMRYDDVSDIAHDIDHFSSRQIGVIPPAEGDAATIPLGLIEGSVPVELEAKARLAVVNCPERAIAIEDASGPTGCATYWTELAR